MTYYILSFLLLGAFIWRVSPLSMDHNDWLEILISLALAYYWLAVLILGILTLYMAIQS